MKINFNQSLIPFTGKAIKKINDDGEQVDYTLSDECMKLILADDVSGEDKIVRYNLAEKIYNSDMEIEITPEDVALIRKLVKEKSPTLVAGIALRMLDN